MSDEEIAALRTRLASAERRLDRALRQAQRQRQSKASLHALLQRTAEDTQEALTTATTEQERSDNVLRAILPDWVADRVRAGESPLVDSYADAGVLFADIVGFTALAATMDPHDVVDLLNDAFSQLDDLAARYGVVKIKTIGDAYLAVSGIPSPREDHLTDLALFALDLQRVVADCTPPGVPRLQTRCGLAVGKVSAGVIGHTRFAYDLWGDTVNVAARMESDGLPDAVQLTAPAAARLERSFEVARRGEVEVKGKGTMETWLLGAPRWV